jgi:alpha-L-rhamnosidase
MTLPARAFPPGRWRASWIWAPGDAGTSARAVVALRRDLVVAAAPAEVPTRLVAASRYALYVNGEEVARGPVRANPRRQSYDVLDLAPYLVPGRNALAVLAWCYRQPMPWWHPLPGEKNDLGQGAFALEARIDDEWLVTDEAWSARALPAWTLTEGSGVLGRGREQLDARALPPDWAVGELEATRAIVRRTYAPGQPARRHPPSYPLGPVRARTLSWPSQRVVALEDTGDGSWTTDAVVSGTVQIEVDGAPGTALAVQVAERLDAAGRPAPTDHDAGFDLTCDGTTRVLETLDPYGLSGLRVSGGRVRSVAVVERLHPVVGDAFFRCSDPRLDQIWEVGRRTVTLCSPDAYVDCPTREQRAWVGDAVVHQLVDLTTNADWSLARSYPRMSASPRADGMLPMVIGGDAEVTDNLVIPDWALHWVHAVWNLFRYVGDRDEIAELMPVVEGVLRWFEPFSDDNGLPTDVMGGVLIDWAAVETDGASAALCGLWGRGLQELAEMCSWLGDAGRARWARQAHERLAAGFELLWDEARGRYADVLVGGRRRAMASQHGQAAAIVGGLVPADRIARLVEVLTTEGDLVHASFAKADGPAKPNSELDYSSYLVDGQPAPWWDVDREVVRAQPFFRYVVHDALALAGRADLVAAACLDWTVLLERCPTSWSETWQGGTTCHGWSSTPTSDLMTRVLGVRPVEPGFRTAHVDPALGALSWARGAVPTPHGMIGVEAEPDVVRVDSPVPFAHGGIAYPAGRHTIRS